MSHIPNQKYETPQFKAWVPQAIRPWIVLFFVLIVNFSGGVYLAAVNEMVGSTQLLQEDIMMAGYASLAGMALFFAIMFRLKMAVRPKTTLTSCLLVLIAANIICMHTHCVPVLVAVCMISGFFRMWAIFDCNTTIQLWITPVRDMSVWFCYIYIIVNGVIQLSGLTTVMFSVWSNWHYMHWFMIGAQLLMFMLVLILYKGGSIMPRIPLFGIDWIGMFIWGMWALCVLFICIYGEHYDWWNSGEIQIATAGALTLLLMNIYRTTIVRRPFIMLEVLTAPIVLITIGLLILTDILIASGHVFEHILMADILGYNEQHIISLNWIGLLGVFAGILFMYRKFAIKKWSYQRVLSVGFILITAHLAYFYFMIDYNLTKEALMLPILLRNAGYVIIAIALITAITRMPYPYHFTQSLSSQNMFSAALAAPIGTAILGRWLTVTMARKSMILSESVDSLHPAIQQMQTSHSQMAQAQMMHAEMAQMPSFPVEQMHAAFGQLYGSVQIQALLESMKEIYGWLLLIGILCLMGLTFRYSDIRPVKVIHPTFRAINTIIRGDFNIKRRFTRRKVSTKHI